MEKVIKALETNSGRLQKIRDLLGKEEMLAGLAEEAGELTQAALKLRRALDGLNPTNKPAIDADEDLQEEIADVMLYAWMCGIDTGLVAETIYKKIRRWENRIGVD